MRELLLEMLWPSNRRSDAALRKADEAREKTALVQEAVKRRNGSIRGIEATIVDLSRVLGE